MSSITPSTATSASPALVASPAAEADITKPHCPFGAGCLRKKPNHRQEQYHAPAPPTVKFDAKTFFAPCFNDEQKEVWQKVGKKELSKAVGSALGGSMIPELQNIAVNDLEPSFANTFVWKLKPLDECTSDDWKAGAISKNVEDRSDQERPTPPPSDFRIMTAQMAAAQADAEEGYVAPESDPLGIQPPDEVPSWILEDRRLQEEMSSQIAKTSNTTAAAAEGWPSKQKVEPMCRAEGGRLPPDFWLSFKDDAAASTSSTNDPLTVASSSATSSSTAVVPPSAQQPSINDRPPFLSKLGGLPYRSSGEKWPIAPCGRSLDFLFQLLLSDMPEHLGVAYQLPDLPLDKQLLQFFMCGNDGSCDTWEPYNEGTRVRIVDLSAYDPETYQPAVKPADIELFEEKLIVGWWKDKDYPCHGDNSEWEKFKLPPLPADADIDQIWKQYGPVEGEKLSGFPHFIQGGGYPDCRECSQPMRFLFQMNGRSWRRPPGTFYAGRYVEFGGMGEGMLFQCASHPHILAFNFSD